MEMEADGQTSRLEDGPTETLGPFHQQCGIHCRRKTNCCELMLRKMYNINDNYTTDSPCLVVDY